MVFPFISFASFVFVFAPSFYSDCFQMIKLTETMQEIKYVSKKYLDRKWVRCSFLT